MTATLQRNGMSASLGWCFTHIPENTGHDLQAFLDDEVKDVLVGRML
jgi:hypothetical protein